MTHQWHSITVTALMLLLLTGCAVGPNYTKQEVPAPKQWAETSQTISTAPLDIVEWWTLFNDEKLNDLIQRAVRSNKDLQLAQARVVQARAQRRVVTSGLFPTVDVAGSYTHIDRNLSLFGLGATTGGTTGGSSFGAGSTSGKFDLYQAGLDASWELDVFGGIRRAVEAANANIAASQEGLRDTLVTLLGEVATDYIAIRGNQYRIEIARRNIEVQRQTVEVTRGQFEAGLGTSLDVAQAEVLLATTEAQVPVLDTSMKQSIHGLGVLLGLEPEALLQELSQQEPVPQTPAQVPIGLPSELLRRRPDVRQAERQLAAATAQIGVATADLFPSFSLTGTFGYQSTKGSNLISPSHSYWTAGPSVSWPLFDADKVRANIQVQTAIQEQTLTTYESTVLTALQDVENAIVAYSNAEAAHISLVRAVDASRSAVQMAQDLYKKGLVDFLNVLQTESSLYQTEDQLAQNEQLVATNFVALFKSLGGGWEILPETTVAGKMK
jgi:multidrug efflux system outer membrane protein